MSAGTDIVASVVGVAGDGFKLALILSAISCEIPNAPTEIRAISKSVTVYALLLKQTASVLERSDSVHSQEAIRTTEQVLDESNAVFNDIHGMLESVRTRTQDGTISPSVSQRRRWAFGKHRIEYLLGRMDRLQMSLSLMLQIIQLGATMASTSRHDSPARFLRMTNKIRRERVEAQTVVIQYFQENQAVRRLFVAAKEEETEPVSPIEYRKDDGDSDALTLVSSQDSQLTKVEEVPSQEGTAMVVSRPKHILIGLGENWDRLGESKEDMVRCSEEIINELLERWTAWRQKREQREQQRETRSRYGGRYNAVVQDESDDEIHDYRDRDDSPSSKYLEGTTTDWRQPHSVEAKKEAARLRKAYRPYQPSVEGSSDVDDSPSSQGSKKRPTRRHAIDSDSDTSESDGDKVGTRPPPRRRSSAVPVPSGVKSRYDEPLSKSLNTPVSGPGPPKAGGPANPTRTPLAPAFSPYSQRQPRPLVTPDQNKQHHSFSTPPATNLGPNGFPQYHSPVAGPTSPNAYTPPNSQTYPFPQMQPGRQGPYTTNAPRLSPQTARQGQPSQQRPTSKDGSARPMSRDGRPPRCPSRLSREYTMADYKAYEEERKRQKKEARRNISDGAAKGLLAGGGLAVFLETLGSLDI